MFCTMMSDNVKARELISDGTYVRAERKENEEPVNSQEIFYEEAYRRLEEKSAKQERMKKVRENTPSVKKRKKN